MNHHRVESVERRPDLNLTALMIPGTPDGANVAIALFVMGWAGHRDARPFLSGSAALGILLGLILTL
jgi:hypothetical protein